MISPNTSPSVGFNRPAGGPFPLEIRPWLVLIAVINGGVRLRDNIAIFFGLLYYHTPREISRFRDAAE